MRNFIVVVAIVGAGLIYTFGIRSSVSNEEAFDFVARALILDEQLLSINDNDKHYSPTADVMELGVGCQNYNLSMVVSGADNYYFFTLTGEAFKTRLIRLDYYKNRTVVGYVSSERYARNAKLKPIISRDIEIGSCSVKEVSN